MIRYTDMHTQERQKIILEFISNHNGCSAEKTFEGVKQHMSRQTFFKCLGILKDHKAIRQENRNKRDKSLHVNKNDLIVRVTNELDYFERTYFELLEKVLLEIKKPISAYSVRKMQLEEKYNKTIHIRQEWILTGTLGYFKSMVDAYAFKLSIKWPFSISDRRYLERLQSMTLDRISKLYNELYRLLKKHNIDDYIKSTPLIQGNIDLMLSRLMEWELSQEDQKDSAKDYELYNLEKEAYNAISSSALSYS